MRCLKTPGHSVRCSIEVCVRALWAFAITDVHLHALVQVVASTIAVIPAPVCTLLTRELAPFCGAYTFSINDYTAVVWYNLGDILFLPMIVRAPLITAFTRLAEVARYVFTGIFVFCHVRIWHGGGCKGSGGTGIVVLIVGYYSNVYFSTSFIDKITGCR